MTMCVDETKSDTFILGRDERADRDVMITAKDLERHMLVVGPTGTGKTTFCAGMVGHAMDLGWQVLVVDGKGDGVLAGAVSSLAELRSKKVLAIDFNKADGPSINPFTDLPADDVAEIVASSLTASGDTDSVWKSRARLMTNTVIGAVSELVGKDHDVDIPGLSKWFNLDEIMKLAANESLSERRRVQVENYLSSLPGFQKGKGNKQGSTTYDQHGYLQMQLSEPLRVLGSRYGHVFRSSEARDLSRELEAGTVVTVTCPAISRSDDDMRIIGSVMTAYIRSIATLRAGLSADSVKLTQEGKASTRSVQVKPLMILFDELESYVVESLVPVVSMGRSLGLRLVFATQEMPEADGRGPMTAVARNTGIKVFKKADDARTWRANLRTSRNDESDQAEALRTALDRHSLLERALHMVRNPDESGFQDALVNAEVDVETAMLNLATSTSDLMSPLLPQEALVYDWRFLRIRTPDLDIGRPSGVLSLREWEEAALPSVADGDVGADRLIDDIVRIVERHAV